MEGANKNRAHLKKMNCFKNRSFKNILLTKVGHLKKQTKKPERFC